MFFCCQNCTNSIYCNICGGEFKMIMITVSQNICLLYGFDIGIGHTEPEVFSFNMRGLFFIHCFTHFSAGPCPQFAYILQNISDVTCLTCYTLHTHSVSPNNVQKSQAF